MGDFHLVVFNGVLVHACTCTLMTHKFNYHMQSFYLHDCKCIFYLTCTTMCGGESLIFSKILSVDP